MFRTFSQKHHLSRLQVSLSFKFLYSTLDQERNNRGGTIVPGTINISHKINELRNRKLHLTQNNPICIIKQEIENHFNSTYDGIFCCSDSLSEVVSCIQNFDDLLIPADHPSKSVTDTYFLDENTILRPQTSAHQKQMLIAGHKAFLVTGDCYRKDTIDHTHYPVFHQMEGVRIWHKSEMNKNDIELDLKNTLQSLVLFLFPNCEYQWLEDYFPFTDPSFEMEVKLHSKSEKDENEWLEIFGCGVIHDQILANCALDDFHGWAFGLGLERLAMILFDIHDVRQFWSTDERFLRQYSDGKIHKFVDYSKYPPCFKDISFWVCDGYHSHEFLDIVRNVAGDMVESVKLMDEFETHGRISHCYRICYRSNDRTLTNEEVNSMQTQIRDIVELQLNVEIRG